MEWIEVTGKTIEDAKELALDRLGVSDADLEFAVVEEPKSGFLGMGRSDARIRARVKPLSREKPDDRRNRRRRTSRGESRTRADEGTGAPSDTPKVASPGAGAGGAVPSARSAQRSRRRGGRGRDRQTASNGSPEQGTSAVTDTAGPQGATMADEIPMEAQREVAEAFLAGLVTAFGLDAHVTATDDGERLEIRIEGEGLGILIGREAATLDALEELTQAVVQTRCDGHASRIRVDVAGYRERRREALAEFTRRLADDVRATGEARRLEPMGSTDRKVVHDVVAEMGDLETTSEGQEPRRYVVIRPAS